MEENSVPCRLVGTLKYSFKYSDEGSYSCSTEMCKEVLGDVIAKVNKTPAMICMEGVSCRMHTTESTKSTRYLVVQHKAKPRFADESGANYRPLDIEGTALD